MTKAPGTGEKVSSEFGLGDGFGQYCSFLNHFQIGSDELIIMIIKIIIIIIKIIMIIIIMIITIIIIMVVMIFIIII